MNPAILLIASLVVAAAFWLGVWIGSGDSCTFWPNGPAFFLNLACAIGILVSLGRMIGYFLQTPLP